MSHFPPELCSSCPFPYRDALIRAAVFTVGYTQRAHFYKSFIRPADFRLPLLKLLELLLGARGLGDLEDVEADGLAEGPALSHSDDVADLHVPAMTPPCSSVCVHSHLCRGAGVRVARCYREGPRVCKVSHKVLLSELRRRICHRDHHPTLSSDSRLSSSFLRAGQAEREGNQGAPPPVTHQLKVLLNAHQLGCDASPGFSGKMHCKNRLRKQTPATL